MASRMAIERRITRRRSSVVGQVLGGRRRLARRPVLGAVPRALRADDGVGRGHGLRDAVLDDGREQELWRISARVSAVKEVDYADFKADLQTKMTRSSPVWGKLTAAPMAPAVVTGGSTPAANPWVSILGRWCGVALLLAAVAVLSRMAMRSSGAA
jgi:hypothetical protein